MVAETGKPNPPSIEVRVPIPVRPMSTLSEKTLNRIEVSESV